MLIYTDYKFNEVTVLFKRLINQNKGITKISECFDVLCS